MRVKDVQGDGIGGYVGCKQKNLKEEHPAGFGDAYCFVAIGRESKLVLAWHLGHRNIFDTEIFTERA